MKTRIEIEQHRITLKDGRAVLLRLGLSAAGETAVIRSIQILGHREACQNIYVVDRQGGPQALYTTKKSLLDKATEAVERFFRNVIDGRR